MVLFFATVLGTLAVVTVALRQKFLPILGWLILTGVLAWLQIFSDFQYLPPRLPLFLIVALIVTTVAARNSALSLPLPWLIGFQAFRIPVEVFLHLGYLAGFVPVQMTWHGRNFDILSGLTALPVAWLASRNRLPAWAVKLWNFGAFALLLNIMTVAILSLPTPLRLFLNEPANIFVTEFPYVWLPAFLVPCAWFGHIALFRRLQNP